MTSDSIQDFLKAQQSLLEAARKQMQGAVRGEAPPPDTLLAARERFTEETRARIDSLKAARAKALERYDTEIRHQEELLSRVEGEVEAVRQRLAEQGPGKGDTGKTSLALRTGDVSLEAKTVRAGRGRPRQVVGQVTDASGGPVPGVELELLGKGGETAKRSATTDEKGEFVFTDVSAGVLRVKLQLGDQVIEKKVGAR